MKDSDKQIAESGIALLLRGDAADLFASLHALELAKRTGKIVHAVVIGRSGKEESVVTGIKGLGDNHFQDSMLLAVWLGQAEGLRVCWHTLLDAADDELVGFFRTHRIFCLITGSRTRKAMQRKIRWLEKLRGRLLDDAHWYPRSFWLLVTEPWDNTMFERVVQQLPSRGSGMAEML